MEPRVRIIGIGNWMRGDDAAGPKVVEAIASRELPEGVDVTLAPEDPIRLIDLLSGCGKAIIVDAALMDEQTGQVRVFRDEAEWSRVEPVSSTHSVDFQAVVPMARRLGIHTPCVLVAIQAERWGFGDPMTRQVEENLPTMLDAVLKEVDDEIQGPDHRR